MAPNRMKTLYGKGVMHYGEYSSITHPKAYKTWSGMIERCYSEKSQKKHPSYKGCSVDTEWLNFQNFVPWFEQHYIENYHLDKDLLVLGNKVYSKNTCVFVPRWLNNILLDSKSNRGDLPIGVTSESGKYKARFSCNGVSQYLGLFTTPEDAYKAYCNAKGKYIHDKVQSTDIPIQIKNNLLLISKQLMEV